MADQMPRMDWGGPNLAENFRLFKQRLQLYFMVKHTPEQDRVPTLLLVGEQGVKRFNCWNLTAEQQADINTIFGKFQEQLEPQDNFRVCRLKLSKLKQNANETLDDFINRCRIVASKCDFSEAELNERLIELIIISTPIPEYQKELLTKDKNFTLNQALQLGRTHEASQAHIQALQSLDIEPSSASNIASFNKHSKQSQREPTVCKNCGGSHKKDGQHCPAAQVTCYSCGKLGHYSKMCLSSKKPINKGKPRDNFKYSSTRGRANNVRRDDRRGQAVHDMKEHDEVEYDVNQDPRQFDDKSFDVINQPNMNASKRDEVITSLNIRLHNRPGVCCTLNGKVDTGAQANTLPVRTFSKMYPEKMTLVGTPDPRCLNMCTSSLTAYNGTPIKQHGTIMIACQRANGPWVETTFYVVDSDGPVIFGLQSSLNFGLITLHCPVSIGTPVTDVNSLKSAYPEQFDRVGEFEGEQHLVVDPNVPSHKDAPRKMPIALADKVKHGPRQDG